MKISSSVVIFASADALFRAPKGSFREFLEKIFSKFQNFGEMNYLYEFQKTFQNCLKNSKFSKKFSGLTLWCSEQSISRGKNNN